jgi:hypothetical protein
MLVGYILFCGDTLTSNNMHEVMSGDISFVFFDIFYHIEESKIYID